MRRALHASSIKLTLLLSISTVLVGRFDVEVSVGTWDKDGNWSGQTAREFHRRSVDGLRSEVCYIESEEGKASLARARREQPR